MASPNPISGDMFPSPSVIYLHAYSARRNRPLLVVLKLKIELWNCSRYKQWNCCRT